MLSSKVLYLWLQTLFCINIWKEYHKTKILNLFVWTTYVFTQLYNTQLRLLDSGIHFNKPSYNCQCKLTQLLIFFGCKLENFPLSQSLEDNFCFCCFTFLFCCERVLWDLGHWIMQWRACGWAVSLKYSPRTHTNRDTHTHGIERWAITHMCTHAST